MHKFTTLILILVMSVLPVRLSLATVGESHHLQAQNTPSQTAKADKADHAKCGHCKVAVQHSQDCSQFDCDSCGAGSSAALPIIFNINIEHPSKQWQAALKLLTPPYTPTVLFRPPRV